jgi:hypothetical protein
LARSCREILFFVARLTALFTSPPGSVCGGLFAGGAVYSSLLFTRLFMISFRGGIKQHFRRQSDMLLATFMNNYRFI